MAKDKSGKAEKTKTPELAAYVDKEPTDLQVRFAKWIEEKTGYEPDLESVKLAVALRMPFQSSPENQAVLEERRKKSEAKAAKRAAKEAASAETETADEPAEDEAPAKPAKATKAAKATTPAKAAATTQDAGPQPAKATGRRRPPAKAAAKGSAEEAF